MAEIPFDEAEVRRRAAALGITIDESQIANVARQMRGALEALTAFDLRKHETSEPANTFDARWR